MVESVVFKNVSQAVPLKHAQSHVQERSMYNLTASIVTYKNDVEIVEHAIQSFLKGTRHAILYVVDNSPTDALRCLCYDPRIIYIFNKKNIGFGAGHNLSFQQVIDRSKYHLVLNPDVYFDPDVIEKLYSFMEENPTVGQLMPKVLYPNGNLQPLCKLLPTPKTLIVRRFFNAFTSWMDRENYHYEFKFSDYDKIMDVPFLSGCFMFLRTEALKKVGFFDERFFLYTEDTDLTRRIHRHYRTVYYPYTSIYHHHARGSYKDPWLTWCNIQSAIRYFNKWGWIADRERKQINERILHQYAR